MAYNINAKRTLFPSFSIGKNGATIFQGTAAPINGSGVAGDIYLYINGGASSLYQNQAGTWVALAAGGSVSSVEIAGSNGIGVLGSPITTSGTITLSLGTIAPSAVSATGNITGANLSGTNTGDQTITLTGDVTGSGTGSFATTLSASGVTAGTYGDATHFTTFTVDSKGRLTAAGTFAIPATGVTSVTAGSGLSGGTITSTGTISLNATLDDLSDVVITTPTNNQVLKYNGTNWVNGSDNSGTGTVTSVTVTGGSGIGVSGSPITTSGTIALTLGSITPTTINMNNTSGTADVQLTLNKVTGQTADFIQVKNGTTILSKIDVNGSLTATNFSGSFSGVSSGTNSGDQTITLTGDVTGSGTGSFATTLSNSGVTAGTYGSQTATSIITVDAKGRVTSASTGTTALGTGNVTGPVSSTATAIAVYSNTAGNSLLNTGITIDSSNNIAGTGTITLTNPGTAKETIQVGGAVRSVSPTFFGFTAGSEGCLLDYNGTYARIGHVPGSTGTGSGLILLANGSNIGTLSNTGLTISSAIKLNAGVGSANTVGFKAPAVLSATTTWTLPSADGTNGQVLSTNGTGVLSWSTISGTGTVTSITAGTGLTGGTITTAGTVAMATSGVTAGTYVNSKIVVDALGRVTSATTGTTAILSVKIVTFTSSGTYTPTAGMVYCEVEVQAAGGGGGASTTNAAGAGGGAGGYTMGVFSAATIGASQVITIGAAGTGGVSNGAGGNAGSTTFGTLLACSGGTGGQPSNAGAGGGGGVITAGTFSRNGQSGWQPIGNASSFGGQSALGFGGFNGIGSGAPGPAGQNGGGGAGGGGGGALSGGAGGNGIVKIVEYIAQ